MTHQISKRQALLKYGFNRRHFDFLAAEGNLDITQKGNRTLVSQASLDNLVEGQHYIVCANCGGYQALISPRHLEMCGGGSLEEYKRSYPGSSLMCALTVDNKKKTEAQKQAQSEKLKARFQTNEGEITRKQISVASKRRMETGYREQASKHLKAMTKQRQEDGSLSSFMKQRWQEGDLREVITRWHRQHRCLSLEMAASARRQIKKRFTSLHQRLKKAFIERGLPGFQTVSSRC